MPAPFAHHEDAHLLVLEKPAGLLCVPGRGADKQDCLSARALARWPEARPTLEAAVGFHRYDLLDRRTDAYYRERGRRSRRENSESAAAIAADAGAAG